jgi:hypothetical protein
MKFLLRLSPDLTIKADKTRRRFLRVLIQNLRDAFANEGIAVHVEPGWVRLVVDADQERAGEVARRVFGVHSVSRVDEHALGTLEELVTTDEEARAMATWSHSGFHVNHSVRLEADDACGILQLARYSARAPVSLERLRYDPRKQQVTLQSDKREGPTAGTHVFPALEFLARLLAHVPDPSERLTRAYGAYSVRRRARSSHGRHPRRHPTGGDLIECR